MFPSLPSLAAVLSQPFKRSQLGLFHGKTKQYGNNVPFSKKKTRRSWLPNIQSKRLYSDALGETVRVKLSTRAIKTIRKVRRLFVVITSWRIHLVQYGGIDQYVLKTKSDLLGWEGMRLRVAVREAQERKGSEASASPSPPGPHTHGTVSNRLDCTLIAPSYPSSFLDIVFHLLLRNALYRLINTPDAVQRWPVPVDAHACVDMVVDSMGREPHVSQQHLFQGPLLAML
jgi:large subunit ribosomal protein L28